MQHGESSTQRARRNPNLLQHQPRPNATNEEKPLQHGESSHQKISPEPLATTTSFRSRRERSREGGGGGGGGGELGSGVGGGRGGLRSMKDPPISPETTVVGLLSGG
jgi:hypothetical protein